MAVLKDGVAIGARAKIGGEIEASIVEPLSNKQHHGFLGHSYVGSWVNLGAGTSNSDLKNTYGSVTMDYGGRRVPSGMQLVGCFIGDYAKTAVNTGIFTGKAIGVCSMAYGFVTTNVPGFTNYARSLGQVTRDRRRRGRGDASPDVRPPRDRAAGVRRGFAPLDCSS